MVDPQDKGGVEKIKKQMFEKTFENTEEKEANCSLFTAVARKGTLARNYAIVPDIGRKMLSISIPVHAE